MMKKIVITIAGLLVGLLVLPLCGFAEEKQHFCSNYADIAIGQYTLGKQYNLPNIVPPAWSDNREGHYNWCMVVPQNMAESETAKRKAYLDQYLPKIISAQKVPEGQKIGSAVKNGASGVAATPISIPRPMQGKIPLVVMPDVGRLSAPDIEKVDVVFVDQNKMKVKLHYHVGSETKELYAGTFLYDAKMKAVNVGYIPMSPQRSSEGDFDVTLILPKEPFHAATIEVFLIRSGKVIVKKYFKCPMVWDGKTARMAPSGNKTVTGTINRQVLPSPQLLTNGQLQTVPAKNGLPIALDPGLGP